MRLRYPNCPLSSSIGELLMESRYKEKKNKNEFETIVLNEVLLLSSSFRHSRCVGKLQIFSIFTVKQIT